MINRLVLLVIQEKANKQEAVEAEESEAVNVGSLAELRRFGYGKSKLFRKINDEHTVECGRHLFYFSVFCL